jgi:hypothetical protein
MTEEEKMIFWGDLVEPMTALLGGLAVRGEDKLYKVVLAVVDKAEKAAKREWQGLTDEEILKLFGVNGTADSDRNALAVLKDAHKLLEAVKEKNT